MDEHAHFMRYALKEAEAALAVGEVPVGAVVVAGGEVVGSGHNLRESINDPTAHAEMIAIREASQKLERWRLIGADIYVTVESCAMCAGAIVLARMDRLIYGAPDEKAGACGSIFNIVEDARLNHRLEVISGILEAECRGVIENFFRQKREKA